MRKLRWMLLVVLLVAAGAVAAQEDGATLIPIPPEDEPARAEAVFTPIQPRQEAVTPMPDGYYAVIVRVRMGSGRFTPEGALGTVARIQQQRQQIAQAQADVLTTLASPRSVQSFVTIPYMALHVDEAGLQALRQNPNVISIVQDDLVEPATYYANPVVGAPQVWAQGYTGEGYAVAIIDTGVDRTHPVFNGGQVIQEACFNTDTAFTDSRCPGGVEELIGPGAATPADCINCEHGTHVAGIAAGNGDNVEDVFNTGEPTPFQGVAPGATIIAVNAFSLNITNDRPAGFDSDIVAGLEYVYRLGVDGPDGVPDTGDELDIASANMSLGGELFNEVCDDQDDDGFVQIAEQLASLNIASVAASGNQSDKDAIAEPACYSNFVSVGATTVEASDPVILEDADGTVAYFSNSAAFLDLLAPGYYITSSVPAGEGTLGADDNYLRLRGTSMASPYVAGAWAIMRQRFPNGSVEDVLEQLKRTGLDVTDNGQFTLDGRSSGNGLTHPLIQLPDAMNLLEPVLISPFTPTLDIRPRFFWENMPLTDFYDISVIDTTTDEVVLAAANVPCSGETSCGVEASVSLVNNRAYLWTVQGKTAEGVVSPVATAGFVVRSATPQGDVITGTPDFVFDRPSAPTVTRFQLEVIDRDNDDTVVFDGEFDVPDVCEVDICTINPQVNLAPVIGNKRLAWRLRSFDTSRNAYNDWSNYREFTVLAPVVTGPTGTVDAADGRPIYVVNRLSDGTNTPDWYRFYVVDRDTDAFIYDEWITVDEANCDATQCAFTPETILYNGNYTVYVNAFTTGLGRSAWSAGRQFTVNVAPPNINTVELVGLYQERLQGVTGTINVTCPEGGLGEPVCEAARPSLDVAYHQGRFSGEWIQFLLFNRDTVEIVYNEWININREYENVVCAGQSCVLQAPDFLENGRYAWYIRTWGPGGASVGGVAGYTQPGNPNAGDPNDLAEFVVALPGEPITALTATLAAESQVTYGMTSTLIEGEVTFSWQAQPTALRYQLQIEDGGGTLIHEQWYPTEDICTEDTCSLVPDGVFFTNGSYDWRVRYWNGADSQASPQQRFTLNLPKPVLPPEASMVVFLDETIAGDTRPRYRWAGMNNATWYELAVQQNGETLFSRWYRALDICDSAGCTVWPTNNLVEGAYRWTVRPWGPAGVIEFSDDRLGPANFSLSGATLGRPEPLTPVDVTVNNSTPTFEWRVADNASWYQLVITREGEDAPLLDQWYYLPVESCTGGVCKVTPEVQLANGAYNWRLRAYGPPGIGDFATFFGVSRFSFRVNAPLAAAPVLQSPLNGMAVETATFVWERGNATWFQLQLIDVAANVAFEQWYAVNDLICDATTCQVTLETLASGNYTWTVAAWRPANGTSGVLRSEAASFVKL